MRDRWRITLVLTHDEPGTFGGHLSGVVDTTDSEQLLATVNEFAGRLGGMAMITPLGDDE